MSGAFWIQLYLGGQDAGSYGVDTINSLNVLAYNDRKTLSNKLSRDLNSLRETLTP